MKKKLHFAIWLALIFSPLGVWAHPTTSPPANPQTILSLKQAMARFGNLMSGIELMQIKEKKPDWSTLETTLNEMGDTLSAMQTADTTHAYKTYTDVLAQGLADLKKKAGKKDPNIYLSFEKLMHTCFGCHAAHRSADYLIPSQGNR